MTVGRGSAGGNHTESWSRAQWVISIADAAYRASSCDHHFVVEFR